jgi:hypothetical protein
MLFGRKQKNIQERDSGKPTTGCVMRAKNGIIKRFIESTKA